MTIRVDGKEVAGQSSGGGAVDASLKAIESLVNTGATLALYSVNNFTTGTDAQGGSGADTDIVIASAKAYINAVNKLQSANYKQHPQLGDV